MTGVLVLLRHGQSTWNALNLFTGWHDVPLSPTGVVEARAAGVTMREAGLRFDIAYTSLLRRVIDTSALALYEMGQDSLPVHRDWRLNERHYGALQGLNKKETTALHGAQQTMLWRRSFDVRPPALDASDHGHPLHDPLYLDLVSKGFDPALLPSTESFKDVLIRTVPFFEEIVAPQLDAGNNVLITAHGNSLRALLMHLENVSVAHIPSVNIPTGVPRRYIFNANFTISSVEYLGDPEAIAGASRSVERQSSL